MSDAFEYRGSFEGPVITGYSDKNASSITIPNALNGKKIRSIDEKAFADMHNLRKVRFENTLSSISIAASAFHNCRNLTDIIFPYNYCNNIGRFRLTPIGLVAEVKKRRLSDDAPYRAYEESQRWLLDAFDTDRLKLEPGFTGLGYDACRYTKGLREIDLPSTVNNIKKGAFRDAAQLEKIVIPDAVREIQDDTFRGCTSLKEIVLPKYLKRIGSSAFEDCSSLESLVIPDGVTTLEGLSLSGCAALKKLTLGKDVRKLGYFALGECASLRDIALPPGNNHFLSANTGLFSPDGKILYAAFSPDSNVYHVPDGVTEIAMSAFGINRHFRYITLPESVRSLQPYAFASAECLEEISLPDHITEIPEYCFAGCDSLRKIHLPEQLKSIGTSAFADCDKLSILNVPETLERIEDQGFENCYELPFETKELLVSHSANEEVMIFDDYY